MPISKIHIKSIDAMRVIAILAVVLIHTSTKVLEVTHYVLTNYLTTLFLNQIARFAVPLFFLISGFVLELSSGPSLNYWAYIKKRFSKIVIPYIFWSLIYYFLIYNQNYENIIRVLLIGNASYQLYFIPTLCIFYLLFPLFHKFYNLISKWWIILPLGAFQFWLLYQDYFVKNFPYNDPVRISILNFFVFIVGIIASHHYGEILEFAKKWKYYLAVFTAFMGFYVFNEGYFKYYMTYNIGAFYSQYRPSVLIYTILIGLIFLVIFENANDKINKIITKLSELSYLVFFIHVIILEGIWKYFGYIYFNTPGFDLMFFIVVGSLSFGSAYLIHKIPNIAKVTG